jgi:hypothetical protein
MRCCVRCFQDLYLIRFIEKAGRKGICGFCGAESVEAVDASALSRIFQPLLDLYEPAARETGVSLADSRNGKSLAEYISLEDAWEIFSDALDIDGQNALLDEIRSTIPAPGRAGHKKSSSDLWARKKDCLPSAHDEKIWKAFADRLSGGEFPGDPSGLWKISGDPRRWLPRHLADIEGLIETDRRFFCADIEETDGDGFGEDEKLRKVPVGPFRRKFSLPDEDSYLGVAGEEATAVAEVRPYAGARLVVAAFRPAKALRVADLTRMRGVPSPFGCEDLDLLVRCNALLRWFHDALVCFSGSVRCLKKRDVILFFLGHISGYGYDGVCYQSLASPGGCRYIFFSPEQLIPAASPRRVVVESVDVRYR